MDYKDFTNGPLNNSKAEDIYNWSNEKKSLSEDEVDVYNWISPEELEAILDSALAEAQADAYYSFRAIRQQMNERVLELLGQDKADEL